MRNAYHETDSIFDSCFSEQASEHLGFLSIGFPIQPAISMYHTRKTRWIMGFFERASKRAFGETIFSFLSFLHFFFKQA
jgi:hypothetical protein